MAKVFIPQVGDKIEISNNWNCKIYNESRNSTVFEALGIDVSTKNNSNIDITFPKGTVFKITRLYVRAPASSFDSITLSIVSSPIKKLAKTKFWVKIMDANNMEFVEKESTYNDFNNLSSLLRDLILKDGNANDQKLITSEKQPYVQKIWDFFKKPENTINVSFKINKEMMMQTYELKNKYFRYRTKQEEEYILEQESLMNLLPEELSVNLTIVLALEGFIYQYKSVESIVEVDTKLDYFNKIDVEYYSSRPRLLGSWLSYNNIYILDNLKKETIPFLAEALNQAVDFEVNGVNKKIKNMKEFNSLIKL